MLEQVQTNHQSRRQPGTAPVRVERSELRLEAAPIDQPGHAHQRVPRVDQGLQPHPEKVLLRLRLWVLGAHRRAPIQGAADRITPRPVVQRTAPFARFCPSFEAKPAKADTSQAPETRRKPPPSAYFTADQLGWQVPAKRRQHAEPAAPLRRGDPMLRATVLRAELA